MKPVLLLVFLSFWLRQATVGARLIYSHSVNYPKANCPKGVYRGLIDENNAPNGNGSYACSRYNYTGSWTHGKRQGLGVTVFANKDVYAGEYFRDFFHGWGDFQWTNGRRYLGEMTFPNGDKYIGDWLKGRRTGHGFYFFRKSGNRYKGNYRDGRKTGRGIFWWTSGKHAGSKYVGEFYNDKRHGRDGKYYYKNGDAYHGPWKNGKQHGDGEIRFVNGNRIYGKWEEGRLCGEAYYIFPNGERHRGNFRNGKRVGDWSKIDPIPFDLQLLYSAKSLR